jgi:hypothetical protein
MNLKSKFVLTAVLAALALAFSAQATPAPERHPAYLHALSDLRLARAHLQRPDGGALHHEEKDAVDEIDKAIGEIKAASIDDGKNIEDHPPVDGTLPWAGRLHKARELLRDAHNDVAKEEDDPAAVGLKDRALSHIDRAAHRVDDAIAIVEH